MISVRIKMKRYCRPRLAMRSPWKTVVCLSLATLLAWMYLVPGHTAAHIKPAKQNVVRGGDSGGKRRPNVLFLIADDMRAEMGVYLDPAVRPAFYPKILTPNLDKLAKKSLVLKRAYVQQALCSPSRTSFLTGRRPDTTRVYDIGTYWRTSGGNFTTIPQFFKQQGYAAVGVGKVFHNGQPSGMDDPLSWTYGAFRFDNSKWLEDRDKIWSAANEEKVKQHRLEDMQIAERAKKFMRDLSAKAKSGEQPFFLAVGFHRPHLPLNCPEKFFDLYPKGEIQLPSNPYAPQGMPDYAWSSYHGVRSYGLVRELNLHGSINTTLPDQLTKDIRRAYYACITYVDSLIGDVLDTLQKLGLADNTIISFLGDHGYQIGEHGEWEKQTNFELTNHAPLMVSVPGMTDSGVVSNALVEFVDLFPTLVDAAGLPALPLCPASSHGIELCTEGLSFLPLMLNPNSLWKTAAFSQYPRMSLEGEIVMGYSIKTDRFRYTEWIKMGMCATNYEDRPIKKRELYDHLVDPDENVNVWRVRNYQEIVDELHNILLQGWIGALP